MRWIVGYTTIIRGKNDNNCMYNIGMKFNHRRQSQDQALIEHVLAATKGVVTYLQRELLGEVLHVIDEQTAQIQRTEAC